MNDYQFSKTYLLESERTVVFQSDKVSLYARLSS